MLNLKELRELADWSQWKLSGAAHVERTRLSLIENGHIAPSGEERAAIEKVLLQAIAERAERFTGVLKALSA